MSLKYQRVKQADLALPAPLRWLTRAFSSITLAVVLLSSVVLYGVVGSVPVAFLAKGGLYALMIFGGAGVGATLAYQIAVGGWGWAARLPRKRRWPLAAAALLAGLAATVIGWHAVDAWTASVPWFHTHRATIIYRLRSMEMTELQFYSWWPLKLILGLFVINLVWATLRRIEFRFVNIGVLTVHTGIVVIAVGSIFYGSYKIEGDTILWRRDLGGEPVNTYYDQTTPALFFLDEHARPLLMLSLADLPRYNDYDPNRSELDLRLHDSPAFQRVFGPHVRATIRGFLSYASMQPTWVEGAGAPHATGAATPDAPANPALRLGFGDDAGPRDGLETALVANIPSQRVIEQPGWAVEYLADPDEQRLRDLLEQFDGPHGLIVEVPAAGFRQTYAVSPGQEIHAGDTGYTLRIESIGDYGMTFATRGYEGARDTRALVQVTQGDRTFRRIALHRYPERTQDFVPAPGDPNVGPMGKRVAPDPAIRLTYIDASKLQYRLISRAGDPDLQVLVRLPGQPAALASLSDRRLPVFDSTGEVFWAYVTQRLHSATQVLQPAITPKEQRLPKDEGTYLHALLPVDLEVASAAGASGPVWRERVWLSHMRYPRYPDETSRPVRVDLPTEPGGGGDRLRTVYLAFSRLERELPFAIALEGFQMQPYPGTDIPRDYVASLSILDLDHTSRPTGSFHQGQARLNNPWVYRGIKLSQIGWDPGDRSDPNHQARDDAGRYLHQQRYTILGVGNNVGIRAIFIGACLVVVGIPWAFYVKPLLLRRQSRKLRAQASPRAGEPVASAA